jgi:radical SAM family RiPP maturation amino acid epimerase
MGPAALPAPAASRAAIIAAPDIVTQVRRFMDVWACDRRFREDLLIDPTAAARRRGFSFDPEDLRVFWDRSFRDDVEELSVSDALKKVSPLGIIWIELRERAKEYTRRLRTESVPSDPRFAAWRERQIARCQLSFPSILANGIPHVPFAIELSKGCSVGCWFCGVSAPKLEGHYSYDEGGDTFRSIVQVLERIVGRQAGRRGILYWATDPLDHPDYERYCADFAVQFGGFPATTTAQGWKDLARTRKLIRLTAAHGNAQVRLSILNTSILDRYLSWLHPEELATVSFVPVNRDSVMATSHAGRARTKRPRSWPAPVESEAAATSIACMSGFLFNLVDKSVRLITPCPSTEQWPDGYIVLDERTYIDAGDLPALVENMIERNMN